MENPRTSSSYRMKLWGFFVLTGDNVYQFLLYFDLLYDKFTDSEKKEFLQSFVERVALGQ